MTTRTPQTEIRQTINDYVNLRSIPMVLSSIFLIASAYQFGAISQITVNWINYTLTSQHAVILSLAIYAIAFASSRTRQLEYYQNWEMVLIAAGPAVLIGEAYIPQVNDLLLGFGDPLGYIIAFVITLISWGVAIR